MIISGREHLYKYMAASSTNSLTLDLTCSGMSFIYAEKRMDPTIDPCGTQVKTGKVLKLVP